MKNEILRLERVTQLVDGVTFLDNFSLHIFEGEIMGLVCVNAHGQEELVRLICRNVPIHYGHVYFQESLVNNYEHSEMTVNRVSVIEKQSRLVEDLTVADNIYVLRRGFKKYVINPRVLETQLARFTSDIDVHIDANELVANLSFFEKCVVELLKAVVTGVKLMIVRDISNFISAVDLKKINLLLRFYAAQGISFLYICNHHEEAFRICDRISLMEDGKVLKVLDRADFRDQTVMRYALDFRPAEPVPAPRGGRENALTFRRVCSPRLRDMSFRVERGECAVLLDMDNTALAGITELMLGAETPLSGEIMVGGAPLRRGGRLDTELCLIGENPIKSTLFHEMTYLDNLCFPLDRRIAFSLLRRGIRKSVVQEYAPLIGPDIYAADITGLSPFSLYNLVYYRVHLYRPRVVICTQPFSGADMYLRHHIVKLIRRLKEHGVAVVILAVSLSDCLTVADRLLVIEHGRLCREYQGDEFHLFQPNS